MNKMDNELRNPSQEKGWEGRKNKGNLGRMKEITLRIHRVGLADVENDRIHLKRNTPVEKD